MIDIFLKAKHWQIFLLTFGLPFLIPLIMMPLTIMGNDPMILVNVFPVVLVLFIGGLLGWFWAIGVGLQNKIPSYLQMKVGRFKTFLLIPLAYISLILAFMGFSIAGYIENQQTPSIGMIVVLASVLVLLHLFSMFCLFYCMYFVAKTLKTVELQKEVLFSDFAGEFFIVWFFPIGIWIIQPKINKIIEY